MFARATLKARVIVVMCGADAGELEDRMLTYAPTVEKDPEMSFQ
jgi:hypothetical protein